MKSSIHWKAIPTALALSLAIAAIASSNPVQTPLTSPVVVEGNSGGSQSGACGFVSANPNQVVRVTEPFASLTFTVEGGGQPTLLITGPNGQNQCVIADNLSGGKIQIPGVWTEGNYSVFVGDLNQSSYPFRLSIVQEN
jgi:hypothetical protein